MQPKDPEPKVRSTAGWGIFGDLDSLLGIPEKSTHHLQKYAEVKVLGCMNFTFALNQVDRDVLRASNIQ